MKTTIPTFTFRVNAVMSAYTDIATFQFCMDYEDI